MTRRTRITLAAATALVISTDAVALFFLGPAALRALDSGRARSWLQTSFRVSRTLSRAALRIERVAAVALAARIFEPRATDLAEARAEAVVERILIHPENAEPIPTVRAQAREIVRARAVRDARLRVVERATRREHLARLASWSSACCGKTEAALTQ